MSAATKREGGRPLAVAQHGGVAGLDLAQRLERLLVVGLLPDTDGGVDDEDEEDDERLDEGRERERARRRREREALPVEALLTQPRVPTGGAYVWREGRRQRGDGETGREKGRMCRGRGGGRDGGGAGRVVGSGGEMGMRKQAAAAAGEWEAKGRRGREREK